MKHGFKQALKGLLVGLAIFSTVISAESHSESIAKNIHKPNILLIIADDLGVGDLECYNPNSCKISTHNINRLASQGLMATDAHAPASVCTPTRYSILTGRYYHRYPHNWNGESLVELDRPTLASVLRQNGYETGYFGKVHTGWGERSKDRKHRQDLDWNKELPRGVLEMGFNKYFGIPFTHNEPPFVFVEDRHVVGLEAHDPLVVIPKETNAGPFGWGASTGAKAAHETRPVGEIDPIFTDKVIAYISENKSKPFFINLAYSAPHVPYIPSKAFKGHSRIGPYGDVVEQLDFCVGRVLDTLEKLNLANNTIVIFTSDNGAMHNKATYATGHRSNGDLLGQKTDAWEGGVRVPLIIRWPAKIEKGKILEQLISLIDLPQTLWAAAEITPPQDSAQDSLNQLPNLLDQKPRVIRKELFMIGITGQALRSGDWVYIPSQGSQGVSTNPAMKTSMQMKELGYVNSDYNQDGTIKSDAPSAQLYNLKNDPRQANNVIGQFPEITKALADRFAQVKKRK